VKHRCLANDGRRQTVTASAGRPWHGRRLTVVEVAAKRHLVVQADIVLKRKTPQKWPHGLWCGFDTARLLGLWVRRPPGAWMSVFCECACVLSGRVLCVGPFIALRSSSECDVSECDREVAVMRRPRPTMGCRTTGEGGGV
jgi:hypothetical protein